VQLNPVASLVLASFYLVTSIALVVILGLCLHLIQKLYAKMELLESKIEPSLVKAEEILTITNNKIVSLGERSEGILTHGEAIAEDVHVKIEKTATHVHRTVNVPIIRLNSVAAGLAHGLQTFSLLQRKHREKSSGTKAAPGMTVQTSPDELHSGGITASPVGSMAADVKVDLVHLQSGKVG
jgi:hypothetical protein